MSDVASGADLYYVRWWEARLKGIVLRPWSELPASIKRIWDGRAIRHEQRFKKEAKS